MNPNISLNHPRIQEKVISLSRNSTKLFSSKKTNLKQNKEEKDSKDDNFSFNKAEKKDAQKIEKNELLTSQSHIENNQNLLNKYIKLKISNLILFCKSLYKNNINNNSYDKNELNSLKEDNKNNQENSTNYQENDIQTPVEYIHEIWFSLLEREKINDYNYNSISSIQKNINSKMRSILIDWLIQIHRKFKLNQPSLFLTVNLIDRYLSKKFILRSKFQLLGIASLFIASKYEEVMYPHITNFANNTDKTFNKTEILEMESEILNELNFELNFPTSIHFFEIISFLYKFNKSEYKNGNFMLELFLLDDKCNLFLQSDIAMAACYIIINQRNEKDYHICFNDDNYFIWANNNFQSCLKYLYYLIDKKENIECKAIMDKYYKY